MDLIERFRYLMKLNQFNASSFAEEIGVQASSVSHILSGRNKPSLEFIQKVLLRFPKVDANWLINGVTKPPSETEQITTDKKSNVVSSSESNTTTNQVADDAKKMNHQDATVKQQLDSEKQIKKIIVLYTDASFEEFNS